MVICTIHPYTDIWIESITFQFLIRLLVECLEKNSLSHPQSVSNLAVGTVNYPFGISIICFEWYVGSTNKLWLRLYYPPTLRLAPFEYCPNRFSTHDYWSFFHVSISFTSISILGLSLYHLPNGSLYSTT